MRGWRDVRPLRLRAWTAASADYTNVQRTDRSALVPSLSWASSQALSQQGHLTVKAASGSVAVLTYHLLELVSSLAVSVLLLMALIAILELDQRLWLVLFVLPSLLSLVS